jgi:hypothetical protein
MRSSNTRYAGTLGFEAKAVPLGAVSEIIVGTASAFQTILSSLAR